MLSLWIWGIKKTDRIYLKGDNFCKFKPVNKIKTSFISGLLFSLNLKCFNQNLKISNELIIWQWLYDYRNDAGIIIRKKKRLTKFCGIHSKSDLKFFQRFLTIRIWSLQKCRTPRFILLIIQTNILAFVILKILNNVFFSLPHML